MTTQRYATMILTPVNPNITFEMETPETGSGFRIRRDNTGEVHVWTYDDEGDLSAHRVLQPSSSHELDDILDFALSVGRAVVADEEEGFTYSNFAVREPYVPEMDLNLAFELTDPESNREIEATLEIGDGGPGMSGTATMSLAELMAAVEHIDARGYGC